MGLHIKNNCYVTTALVGLLDRETTELCKVQY